MFRTLLTAAALAAALTCQARAEASIVETAQHAGQFETLLTAVKQAGLAETLMGEGPYTVFAPTDAAFAKLKPGTLDLLLTPEGLPTLRLILKHHVLAGAAPASAAQKVERLSPLSGQPLAVTRTHDGLQIGQANVVKADVHCTNGVIHVIDRVLLPNTKDLVETAQHAGQFETLLAAAKAAGLVEALQGEGPLTVFAPSDAAFAKLPEGTVASLLRPENRAKLAAILKAHVVSGRIDSAAALKAGEATTLGGAAWTIGNDEGAVRVGPATVLQADVYAANGVIHVIDQVLIPAEKPACGSCESGM
ncbi:MAG: fasciclin domain-containing protein [Planctomycetota bacterium]